jgi:hypothetical protein
MLTNIYKINKSVASMIDNKFSPGANKKSGSFTRRDSQAAPALTYKDVPRGYRGTPNSSDPIGKLLGFFDTGNVQRATVCHVAADLHVMAFLSGQRSRVIDRQDLFVRIGHENRLLTL